MLGRNRPPPAQLAEVHLIVEVAGLRQVWRFEPAQGLEFSFPWNRTDGYNRTVYGSATAKGKILNPNKFLRFKINRLDASCALKQDIKIYSNKAFF